MYRLGMTENEIRKMDLAVALELLAEGRPEDLQDYLDATGLTMAEVAAAARCSVHPAFESDNCPGCGTQARI